MENTVCIKNTVVLGDSEACIHLRDDGSLDLVFPEIDGEKDTTAAQLLAVAMAYMVLTNPEDVMDAIDYVTENSLALQEAMDAQDREEAERLDRELMEQEYGGETTVSGDTEEAEDDTVPGD